jgi:hypothetical protein
LFAVTSCIACSSGSSDGATRLDLTTHFFEGSYELSGTVTFNQTLAKGTTVQLMLTEVTNYPSGGLNMGNEMVNRAMASAGAEIPWAIHSIGAGDYWVSVSADLNHSNWMDEGDSGGYFDGTPEHPIQLQAKATKITITNASLSNLDFGAGAYQCLANWGEHCSEDGDCRGASCSYPDSLRVSASSGSCVDTVCATPSDDCPELSGSAGTLVPSECFGGP